MKPAKFEYDRVSSLDDALRMLASPDSEVRVLGGGQSLGPMMNLRLAQPDRLVDLGRVGGLDGIETEGGRIRIGARVTHARIEDGAVPGPTGLYMRSVAAGISYRSVRNRGTIGGSLAHADPSADWPAALLATGGDIVAVGAAGERKLSLDGFQTGPFTTALGYDEIVVAVELPQLGSEVPWGYYKVCRKPGEFADAIGAVTVGSEPRVICGATGAAPFRVAAVEERLADGARELSIPDGREILAALDPGFDDYELQIHAVALSRAIGRAFA